jgi:hypothetical protein
MPKPSPVASPVTSATFLPETFHFSRLYPPLSGMGRVFIHAIINSAGFMKTLILLLTDPGKSVINRYSSDI